MKDLIAAANKLLVEFKADNYAFGPGVLGQLGPMTAQLGHKALLVGRIASPWFKPILGKALACLKDNDVQVLDTIQGADPNAPRQDVRRLAQEISRHKPEVIVSIEAGSGIDACKAAAALATFGDLDDELDSYFGVDQITNLCQKTGRKVVPLVAVMTAASSAAHLTKYSNVTDMTSGQKKLIIDQAIVPPRAIFDYSLTRTQPMDLTLDGGLDGVSHCLEVYLGAKPDQVQNVEQICLAGIELIIAGLKDVAKNSADLSARQLIALGTDLGGYAIMLGGTNGPHLNSFSLVKYLTHGRACALMNPYYVVFFAPAVADRLVKVAEIYRRHGYLSDSLDDSACDQVGLTLARAMMDFNRSIGFPTKLSEVEGIQQAALDQALSAAKNPQLASKLQNMPVPLSADSVDKYMGSVLSAAWDADLNKIITQ